MHGNISTYHKFKYFKTHASQYINELFNLICFVEPFYKIIMCKVTGNKTRDNEVEVVGRILEPLIYLLI